MSEEELDEIVQITVEDFTQDEQTGMIPLKQTDISLTAAKIFHCFQCGANLLIQF